MNYQEPTFHILGERSILIDWKPVIREDLLKFILFTKKYIENYRDKPIVEVIHTYSSLLIVYDSSIKNIYDEIRELKLLVSTIVPPEKIHCTLHHLPVCYAQKFGVDLKAVSAKNKLSVPEIKNLHSAKIHTVYFMGFLPGFLYLGGLDKKLFCPRKKQPRKRIKKGAVGIGGKQTGIYPKVSPGGWQIIGNCPLYFFDVNENPPSIFKAGDKIKFYPIGLKEHQHILKQQKSGNFRPKTEPYEF